MRRVRLGVLVTHPVQYHAPLFRVLAANGDVDLTVFFAHKPPPQEQGWEFGVGFEWDVDLTQGYHHEWLANRATRPSASTFDGCDTPDIAEAIGRRAFDAFLIMGWHSRSYWQGMRACWRHGVPVVVRGDSQLLDDRPVKRAAKRLVYPHFVRRFAACLSTGTRSAEYFRYYGARRVVASPHFVDNALFAAQGRALEARRSTLRAQWGIPADAFVLGFAGKLIPRKRPVALLEAVALTGRRDAWVLVAGDGELRRECEREAARLRVPAAFAGFLNQSRIAEAYVASDALVLPSSQETWGLVVNEAMACGRAALVCDAVGCAPDLVTDGETGFRFALADVPALAERIALLAADRAMAARMGAAARARVSAFSVEAAAAGILTAASVVHGERVA